MNQAPELAKLRAGAALMGHPTGRPDQARRPDTAAPPAAEVRPAQQRESGRLRVVAPVGRQLTAGLEEGIELRGEVGAVVEQPDDVRQTAPSECRVAANVGRADDEARATIDRARRQHGRRAAITSPSATRRPVASRASVERNRVRVLRTRWTATPPRPSRCVAGNSSEAHRITAEVVRLLAGQWRGIGQLAWRALHGTSATPAR